MIISDSNKIYGPTSVITIEKEGDITRSTQGRSMVVFCARREYQQMVDVDGMLRYQIVVGRISWG